MNEQDLQVSMAQATATSEVPEREYLRTDEIGRAFDDLSPDDKLKLGVIEMTLLSGTGLEKGDLLQEAVYRALDGDRKCPRGVSFMAFLVMTMKSVASHARTENSRTVVTADPAASADAAGIGLTAPCSPEDLASSASVVEEIYSHFEDDEEASLVLLGWAEGLRGRDLREATGLNQGDLDYAIRRIRTRMRKLYPTGWMP